MFSSFILYADNDLANPDEMKSFLHSPEDISNVFTTQPRNMLTLTHTNYLCHFDTIEHALGATDILTRADIFINDWRVSRFYIKYMIFSNDSIYLR